MARRPALPLVGPSHRHLGVGALLVLGGAAATGLALTGYRQAARGATAADRRSRPCALVLFSGRRDRRRDFAVSRAAPRRAPRRGGRSPPVVAPGAARGAH